MRYCSHCGNPLSPGASFCHTCGAALKTLVPEADEAPVAAPAMEPVAEPVVEPVVEAAPVVETPVAETPAPVVIPARNQGDILQEKEFLEQTNRLLRWERKAWSITGKVMLIVGIVFAALFFLLGIVFAAIGDDVAVFSVIYFVYALVFGLMFIAIGIVNTKAAGKIDQYTDTLFKDFRAAYKRCGSIGMIVLCYIFNSVSLVFFVINFVRMKTNRDLADRILTRQGVKE